MKPPPKSTPPAPSTNPWEGRQWRKLYITERGSFSRLPMQARGVAHEVLLLVDRDGRLFVGKESPADVICHVGRAYPRERRPIRRLVALLFDQGYLVRDGDYVVVADFAESQRSRHRLTLAHTEQNRSTVSPQDARSADAEVNDRPRSTTLDGASAALDDARTNTLRARDDIRATLDEHSTNIEIDPSTGNYSVPDPLYLAKSRRSAEAVSESESDPVSKTERGSQSAGADEKGETPFDDENFRNSKSSGVFPTATAKQPSPSHRTDPRSDADPLPAVPGRSDPRQAQERAAERGKNKSTEQPIDLADPTVEATPAVVYECALIWSQEVSRVTLMPCSIPTASWDLMALAALFSVHATGGTTRQRLEDLRKLLRFYLSRSNEANGFGKGWTPEKTLICFNNGQLPWPWPRRDPPPVPRPPPAGREEPAAAAKRGGDPEHIGTALNGATNFLARLRPSNWVGPRRVANA